MVVRRPVAWIVAIVLFVEALGVAALNWFLGIVVDRQDMSLAGLDPDMMSTSSKIGGIVFGLYFGFCGLVALLVALRDRAPAGLGRVLLISVAVVHGLLGAFAWGLMGWPEFLFMVLMLGLVVLLLMTYDSPAAPAPADAPPPGGTPNGANGDGGSPITPPPAPSTS
ncbi:Integral membrane protein OS=Streptomyces alboniger OX=132473 GN=CP975_22085 PE=4 SV=1 [Streptomyces alboniger]